ncbi:putative MFS family arabinose efflux permease [Pseudoduganella flava]|uniref:MFS transporter n=1 Tax=Pseudoduganella flava TaxID=871742 RepID=A0A562PQS0_9BURK|nr:MFS transporter [Pseudoduganella flava]QGZ37902.1 MFS transporter [Pseudoduganella flava]TWI46738.1 putative MFS family arabinose efflux permease [Pseudoduganella flava]
MSSAHRTLAILAFTQIASWGSLYYGITILGPALGAELGWRNELVYGAYSWSLILSGLAATPAGALLDRHGGRAVMGLGSLLGAFGMLLLAGTQSVPVYFVAWTILGFAMALTLYEAAFATINREFGWDARQLISTLTLFGGFASTVFWPLTMRLDGAIGWRATCVAYAALHLFVCLPLHLCLPRRAHGSATPANESGAVGAVADLDLRTALRHPAFWKLACAFAVNALIFSALAVHLIPMLKDFGHGAAAAVTMAALIGPAQVAGRIAERVWFRDAPPANIGRLAFAAMPAGLLAIGLWAEHQWAAGLFCVLLGASNGVLTIVRGTVPQQMFGRRHYGAIAGAMAGPSLLARAAGPLLTAALLGAGVPGRMLLLVFLVCAVLSLLCFLSALQAKRRAAIMDAPL